VKLLLEKRNIQEAVVTSN